LETHVLAYPGRSAFVVDEATTLTDHPDTAGARALGDAVQKWRKFGIECHIVTQRVSDWLGTAIGRKIQGILSVKWYGAQEPAEIAEIARREHWTEEEAERIGGAGSGEGVLVAFDQRVWADLFDHCSDDEYGAFETDPPEKVEQIPSPSRNGHVVSV
jgi:hypothetical protein